MRRTHDYRLQPWLVPSFYAATAITVGIAWPRFEDAVFSSLGSPVSISAAMTIYSTIAAGMIALTGIVFSLTFVMIQFSASAYSPRLALFMVRDPFLAHALGMFIATFVYALAALAWLDRLETARVPLVSFCLVVALLLASMGMFIALIERVGMLQVNRMLTFIADQGREVIAASGARFRMPMNSWRPRRPPRTRHYSPGLCRSRLTRMRPQAAPRSFLQRSYGTPISQKNRTHS